MTAVRIVRRVLAFPLAVLAAVAALVVLGAVRLADVIDPKPRPTEPLPTSAQE